MGDCRVSREFLAVLAQSDNLAALTHLASTHGRPAKLPHMLTVQWTKAFGNEDSQRLPDRLFGSVAEDRLGALVEEDDLLGGIDADDRVRRNRSDFGEHAVGYVLCRNILQYGHRLEFTLDVDAFESP